MSWHTDHVIHYLLLEEKDAFKPVNWYFTLQHYAAILCAMEFEIHPAAREQFNLSTITCTSLN